MSFIKGRTYINYIDFFKALNILLYILNTGVRILKHDK